MLSNQEINTRGRIGNNLFCIASTIGLAHRYGVQYQFPVWRYQQYFANRLPTGNSRLHRTIRERDFTYGEYPELSQAKHLNFGLSGYWQSPKYWEEFESEVRRLLAFHPNLMLRVQSSYPILENETCISVRRGDYIGNPNYVNITLDHYYHPAIFKIGTEVPYLIFSDDIEWCKQAFAGLSNVRFIEDLSDIESLARMSLCRNFITANSTYSWWGAYLSATNGRIIRPAQYYAGELLKKCDIRDLYPENWEVI